MNKSQDAQQDALKTCQRQLQASEARFRNTIDNNADGILIIDKNGIVRFANPAATAIFGRETKALIGENFGFPVVAGDKAEVDIIRTHSEPVTAEMRVTKTSWEGDSSHLVSLRDITERKQAEDRITHFNDVLRAIRNVNQLIAREKDRNRLLQGVCKELVEARGYYNVWITLLDDKNKPLIIAEAGLGETFHPLLALLKRNKPSHCIKQALDQGELLVIEDPIDACPDCPLAENYNDRGALSIRLQHRGNVYGVLTASTPKKFITDPEEHSLFKELAGDIALALHSITLEEQRKELERIVNRSPAVAFLWQAKEGWPVEYVSENVEQFGYTPDDFYSGRVTFTDIIHPDDLERVGEEVAHHGQAKDKQFTQEYRIMSKSGEIRWVDDRTWIRYNAEGEITHYEGIILDLTERKRAEESLRESEERYRRLVENMDDLIYRYELTPEREFSYVSPSATEITGYTPEEHYQDPDLGFKLIHPEDRRLLEDLIEKEEEIRKPVALRWVKKDGRIIWTEQKNVPIYDDEGNLVALEGIARDITDRKQMEEALRESEERFRNIVEQSYDGIVLMDQEGRIIEWNKGQEQIMGLAREEVLGQFIWDVQYQVALDEKKEDPKFHDRLKQQINKYLEENHIAWSSKLSEREIQRPDGTHRIVQSSVFPIQTNEGTLVSSITRDITAQRRMEERLRKLSRAVEQSPSAVVITDTQGDIEYVNPKFTKMTGYSSQEVKGRNPRILKSGHQPPEFYETMWGTITNGQEWRGEFCNQKKDGEIYWELASISPIRNGKGHTTHYLKVAEDVTERREMEEALRHSEQHYRTLFNHAGDAIFVHSVDGRFLDVNQIACERLGYSREELLQMTPRDVVAPEDADHMPERIKTLQEVGHIVFETTQVRRDGTYIPVEINSRHIEYDGQPAILSIARDITKRKEVEEKIERYAADLKRSNQELEQFAYVVSHDLQEPVRMVKSYMELLERRYQDELDEKANMFIDYAVDGAQRMQEMIQGMLDLSRVGTQGNPLAPTDVEEVLERTLKVLKQTIEKAETEVTHDPLPTVTADEAQLAQVFQNLIANAIKFRREDVTPRVHISAEREGNEWLFSVEDNGIGINPDQADRIFQVFQRLHTQEEYEGTGIGLALCRRIVERHGGRIWFESEPGEGTTFYFTLPT